MNYTKEYLEGSPCFVINEIAQNVMTGEIDSQIDYCGDRVKNAMIKQKLPFFSDIRFIEFGTRLVYEDADCSIEINCRDIAKATCIAYILINQVDEKITKAQKVKQVRIGFPVANKMHEFDVTLADGNLLHAKHATTGDSIMWSDELIDIVLLQLSQQEV